MSRQQHRKGAGRFARVAGAGEPLPKSTETRIARIPYSDCYPSAYGRLEGLSAFECELDQRLEGLLQGAVDCGNGAVFDAQIDSATEAAHFELEIEHTLRTSMAHLIVLRNQGDAVKVDEQLQDVQLRLAATSQELTQATQAVHEAERARAARAAHGAERARAARAAERAQAAQEAHGAERARAAHEAERAPRSRKPRATKQTVQAPKTRRLVKDHGID